MTTRITETYTMVACVDCTHLIVNGELPGDTDMPSDIYADMISERWPEDGHFVINMDDHDPFSWSPCGICGTDLGGERYGASFLEHGHDHV